MSAAQRMPILGGTLALGTTGAAMALIPSFREAVTRYLGISAPGGVWRILAIFFALLSIKSLPFVWHVSHKYLYTSQFLSDPQTVPRLQEPYLATLSPTDPAQKIPPLRSYHYNLTQLHLRMRLQLPQEQLDLLLRS